MVDRVSVNESAQKELVSTWTEQELFFTEPFSFSFIKHWRLLAKIGCVIFSVPSHQPLLLRDHVNSREMRRMIMAEIPR